MELIGWISSLCLVVCGVPQAYKAVREGHAKGMSPSFIALWTLGEVFGVAYVFNQDSAPLQFNYLVNLLVCLVLCYYTFRRRNG